MKKWANFTQFEQKNTHISGCKIVHLYIIGTVTVHIYTVIVACAFNILLVFSLSYLCSHSHSHLTLSLSLLSPHLTPPFPHLLLLSPLPLVKPCLHCRRSSNPPLLPVKSITLAAMSEDASSYLPIEPTNFDLIVSHPLSFSPFDQNSQPISHCHYHRLPPPPITDLSTDLIAFLYFWLFDQWVSG